MKTILRNAALAAAVLGSAGIASADSIPGMRGHDHTGITVPDMKQAVDFFTEVVGCKKAMSFGPFADDKGTFMQDLLGVDPKAVIEQITMVRPCRLITRQRSHMGLTEGRTFIGDLVYFRRKVIRPRVRS